jgi:hypothetical protein
MPSSLSTERLLSAALWRCRRLFPTHYPPPATGRMMNGGLL